MWRGDLWREAVQRGFWPDFTRIHGVLKVRFRKLASRRERLQTCHFHAAAMSSPLVRSQHLTAREPDVGELARNTHILEERWRHSSL
ncbi:hypothetical protein GJAV_G00038680 [Gymnothorax javanicus]|nr:hypothetical protein GJAV_G00038680 [Gymnothorax javanicus]